MKSQLFQFLADKNQRFYGCGIMNMQKQMAERIRTKWKAYNGIKFGLYMK